MTSTHSIRSSTRSPHGRSGRMPPRRGIGGARHRGLARRRPPSGCSTLRRSRPAAGCSTWPPALAGRAWPPRAGSGPTGQVLATDISPAILEYAAKAASDAGLTTITTRELDGEHLDVDEASFDAVISRVGLIYFPDQQAALAGMRAALRPGGRLSAVVYSTADRNGFFADTGRHHPSPRSAAAASARAAWPVQPRRRQASPSRLLPRPGSATSRSRRCRRRCGWPAPPTASPSNVSRSARCIRCCPASPKPIGTPPGPRSTRRSPQFEGPDGFVGPCEMLVVSAVR